MRNKDGNLIFENVPCIASCAAVVGKKEGEGPLRDYFDRIIHDSYVGKDTFEKAESELMKSSAAPTSMIEEMMRLWYSWRLVSPTDEARSSSSMM